ncbi:MAG: ABC transporter ATP-binding protein [Eubacteriales bacterium]|nr:ABC transporter ATP-binding protein [Christensenellaceae bacterium]MEA5064853.1 ABC transporter ATP-binding protein [Eubacteriales bacterium]
MNELLKITDLHVSFMTPAGEVKAVNGVSYTIKQGKVLGIVGESGSGKSVSVNALMGLVPEPGRVTGGSITFDGRDVLAMNKKQLRGIRGKEIGMVFQDPMTSLNPVFTIGNQLMETLKLHTRMTKDEAHKRSVESLALVGIPNPERRMNQYPHEFSGGMRQRAMIAMTLLCQPKLLIADEPTTALDVTIQAQILELMKNLKRKINSSIILITHDLGIVSDLCDEVIVMYAGRIAERGSIDDIFYRASHPYTIGLLKCLPRLDSDRREPLVPIEGTPVDLIALPKGCAFAPRCVHCMKLCLAHQPPLMDVGEGHESACWLHALEEDA